MPTAKRELTLADRVILDYQRESLVTKPIHDRFIGRVRAAKRFVLDVAACKRIGAVIRDVPELLIREQQFARAPYDVTWIEWPNYALWEEINQSPTTYADQNGRVGMLIDHGIVYTVTNEGNIENISTRRRALGAWLMPFTYELHTPWNDKDVDAFCQLIGLARDLGDANVAIKINDYVARASDGNLPPELAKMRLLDYLYWGSATGKLSFAQMQVLRESHSMQALPLITYGDIPKAVGDIVTECAGDLRNLIGILLMLNRPSVVRYVRDMPHMRGFVGGKLRSYMTYTECTIDLDPTPVLRRIGTVLGDGDTKRRHEVRYTWCHDEVYRKGTAAGCVHTWEPHPDYIEDIDHLHVDVATGAVEWSNFKCTSCGGHRWWREKHERGDASKGWVDKTYRVTA